MSKYLTIVLSFLFVSASAQEKIDWITWDEAVERQESNPKKILVDLYTSWCGWCKKMDKTTLSNEKIAAYINENYHAVKFDAEQRETINFRNKEFKYVGGGFGRRGYHMLAAELTQGKLSYPTYTFLDENMNLIQPISGYHGTSDFQMILVFFGDDHFRKTPWKVFAKNYKALRSEGQGNQAPRGQIVNYKNNN